MTMIEEFSQFNMIKPWEVDLEDPAFRWALYHIYNSKIPDFVFKKPSDLMESRISFLVSKLHAGARNWIVCFSDSNTYLRILEYYVAATYVFTTGKSVDIEGPGGLINYAFNLNKNELQFSIESPIIKCSLLIIKYFDYMYPGYTKAIPRIADLLLDRKIKKKPFLFVSYSKKLPANVNEVSRFAYGLSDFFGEQARDLFSDNTTKFVILKGEESCL